MTLFAWEFSRFHRFRGFLFQDQQPGVRLFGDRDGNRLQYNLAAFGRLDKDTHSGLASAAILVPGGGFQALFDAPDRRPLYYSVLFNAVVSYRGAAAQTCPPVNLALRA